VFTHRGFVLSGVTCACPGRGAQPETGRTEVGAVRPAHLAFHGPGPSLPGIGGGVIAPRRWVPGDKLVPVGLAREFGLAALGDDDPLHEISIDEPIPAPVGAVDGSLVETFVDGLKGRHLCDVLNVTLLAQLAANVKYDREAEPVPWTKYYTRVLENVGWVVLEFSFSGPRSHETGSACTRRCSRSSRRASRPSRSSTGVTGA
jgi:hypothetical protein